MNKQEALQAMKSGKKITHPLFDKNEFLYWKNGKICDEANYIWGDEFCEGWTTYRDAEIWQKGWKIHAE